MDLDQSLRREVPQQRGQVAVQARGRDVVLGKQSVADMRAAGGLLQQRPDPRADRIEPVVGTGAKVEDRGFAGQVSGDLVPGIGDDGIERDTHYPMDRPSWGLRMQEGASVRKPAGAGGGFRFKREGRGAPSYDLTDSRSHQSVGSGTAQRSGDLLYGPVDDESRDFVGLFAGLRVVRRRVLFRLCVHKDPLV